MAEKVKAVVRHDISSFNQEANELAAEGWEMDHGSFRVSILDSSTGPLRHFYATFRKYPQPVMEVAHDPIERQNIPTPYDDAIKDAKTALDGAISADAKMEYADKIEKLIEKQSHWRHLTFVHPELASDTD